MRIINRQLPIMSMNLAQLISRLKMPRALATGALAGLLIITLVICGYSVWQWRNDWLLSRQEPAYVPVVNKNEKNEALIAAIPEHHLFGKSPGQMPISNLQMIVTGIVKMSQQSGQVSKAYISIEGQPGKVYQQGDELRYGVKLYAVADDAVIVENDGHFEKLPLPREKLKFKPAETESIFND